LKKVFKDLKLDFITTCILETMTPRSLDSNIVCVLENYKTEKQKCFKTEMT